MAAVSAVCWMGWYASMYWNHAQYPSCIPDRALSPMKYMGFSTQNSKRAPGLNGPPSSKDGGSGAAALAVTAPAPAALPSSSSRCFALADDHARCGSKRRTAVGCEQRASRSAEPRTTDANIARTRLTQPEPR